MRINVNDWLGNIPKSQLESKPAAQLNKLDLPRSFTWFTDYASVISLYEAVNPLDMDPSLVYSMIPVSSPPIFAPTARLYIPTDETFAELIFPGFDSDSIIWKISSWQIVEFLVTLVIGQRGGSPSTCTLYNLGASWGPSIARGEIWRLITPMTLHANMMHLFFNIFFQLRIGFNMEKQFGKKRFLLIYCVCGIIGNLISVSIDPYKLAVGASTAGFGLIGVWLAELSLSWHIMRGNRERSLVWIGFMVSAMVMMSAGSSSVDVFGHIGGSLGGFLVAVLLSDMPHEYKPVWYEDFKTFCRVSLGVILVGCCGKVFLMTPHYPIPHCSIAIDRLHQALH